MTTAKLFRLHVAAIKPGDFGPCAYAVWASDYKSSVTVADGAIVEAIGPVETSVEGDYDDRYELQYRNVRTSDGFEGMVCWHEYAGHSGFEAL